MRFSLTLPVLCIACQLTAAQVPGNMAGDLKDFARTPAITGYEATLAGQVAAELKSLSPQRDNLGDVTVTVGRGEPRQLFITPLDEPGYIVTGITPDGYLRLQRLPTRANLPLFNELQTAEPVRIGTVRGGFINGVIAGISVHLQPGRLNPPDPNDLDNMYVDIGATSAAAVRAAGVDILSPVGLDTNLYTMQGGYLTAPGIGDKFGAVALIEALRQLNPANVQGTVAVAFVTQQWAGARGMARVLEEQPPATKVIYVGRLDRPLRDTSVTHWGIPVAWPSTPAEMINGGELASLVAKIEAALGVSPTAPAMPTGEALPEPHLPAKPAAAPTAETILKAVAAPYGVNPHERRVGETIQALLPPWAKPSTDASGNIILHWGSGNANGPRLLFVAHQDEIGFDVASIADDGRLVLRSRGGGDLDYYVGHPILVHSAGGMFPGVTELPSGWQARGFKLAGSRITVRADIGARSAQAVEALGIQVGDSVTIPKQYRTLLGRRATVRAFDDRVGDSALIAAAWALGPQLPGRDVTFLWSVAEEIGLVGAKEVAERLAKEGRAPDYVFAIDTFVSSDSPLESHRFADTPIGDGFVIRAVDDSSIIPWPLAQRLQAMARAAGISVQIGQTGGGNDGSVFPVFGAVDVPLSWPLRYSHSPGEVIDTRDLDSLTRALDMLARHW